MRLRDFSLIGLFVVACGLLVSCDSGNKVSGTVTDTGNTIAGVVKRSDGKYASAALVRMARVPNKGDSLLEMSYVETLTDSQGVFSFDSALADTFQLAVIDAKYSEISYLPRIAAKSDELDSIRLEKAAVFSSVLYYEDATEPAIAVGSHFKVFLPGMPFSQSVFAGDSFSMLIPAGSWWFTFCPGDPEMVARLADSGFVDTSIYRRWTMDDELSAGDTLSEGPFLWSTTAEIDTLIKENEKKAEEVQKQAYISGVVKCGKNKGGCSNVQVQMVTDLYGFGFVEGDSVEFKSETVTDSKGRWWLPAPRDVPDDSFRVEFRKPGTDSSMVLSGVSRYVKASEVKNLKDTLDVGESTLLKASSLVSGVRVVLSLNKDDDETDGGLDSLQSDNCMMNSVVVGIKGTSHFVREVTCNMLEIDDVPAGIQDIVLYSGDVKVVNKLRESKVPADKYVVITHVELPEGDTLSQQWMTYSPLTLTDSKFFEK